MLSWTEHATHGLQKINTDAHADARVTTGRAAGPNRVRIFALWTGHGETAVPIPLKRSDSNPPRQTTDIPSG